MVHGDAVAPKVLCWPY